MLKSKKKVLTETKLVTGQNHDLILYVDYVLDLLFCETIVHRCFTVEPDVLLMTIIKLPVQH